MNQGELGYLALLEKVKEEGQDVHDRTGVGTKSLFGEQLVFDLTQGFPLLTTKKVLFKALMHELIWMLRGETDLSYLKEHNVNIWNEWADASGDLGPVYGKQWRSWGEIDEFDQIAYVIDQIKNNPSSRRLLVSAWNPTFLPEDGLAPCQNPPLGKAALPACHTLFQFYVRKGPEGRYLDCQLYQRSGDIFLGVPFNIASYSLLTYIIAHICDLKPGRFIHTFGDVHLYNNHHKAAKTQLEREPGELPKVIISGELEDIDDLTEEHIKLINYNPQPFIKAPVAV